MHPQNVAILLFNEVEVLDFAGPYEVFSVANIARQEKGFNVYTFSRKAFLLKARNGLQLMPKYAFPNCPSPAILIIPGGNGRIAAWAENHHPS